MLSVLPALLAWEGCVKDKGRGGKERREVLSKLPDLFSDGWLCSTALGFSALQCLHIYDCICSSGHRFQFNTQLSAVLQCVDGVF